MGLFGNQWQVIQNRRNLRRHQIVELYSAQLIHFPVPRQLRSYSHRQNLGERKLLHVGFTVTDAE